MHNNEYAIRELYETLEKLRYPEVAQTHFNEFEKTILTGNKRIDLLHWLLKESPHFNGSALNKLKDNNIGDKLFKCYSQIGLCSDEDIFLGKCAVEKQYHFLSLLTIFIKNVHLADIESIKTDYQTENNFLKVDTNCENTSPNMQIKISNNDIKNSSINDKVLSLESPKISEDELMIETYSIDSLYSKIKVNIKELNEQNFNIVEPVLQEFNTFFKKLSAPPIQDTNIYKFPESENCINTDIQKIHSIFSNVNKTIINEAKISDRVIPDISTKTSNPLIKVIKDNLILIEQAQNILKET